MHIVTFYSFKGGTGRSMALVNVAVELAKSGLRVLVVDFDLEAPGLDTFNLPRPQKVTRGVVDLVLDYLDKGQSPDVSEFVYKSALPNADGQLWVMPSGGADLEYDSRFKSINWRQLYKDRDGYLLFEDVKTQWEQLLKPDYVLIDSRTGHTDVAGICTRQLPDSVVLFFFPNEQNRRGLETVVRQVRAEAETDRKKTIKLHFVMSNVPELDDEEGFLANNVARLKESLKFEELSAIIHHYPSLALVTQSVFTLDRPRTRLAQEYATLARVIRKDNLKDREVALEFLDEMAPRVRARHILGRDATSGTGSRSVSAGELEQRIQDIRTNHSEDSEVLMRLALLLRRQRRFEEALTLLERAGELGANSAAFYLARAELYTIVQNSTAALQDVRKLLKASDATFLEVSVAARLLLQRDPASLGELIQTPAFTRLDADGQYYVASELFTSRQGLGIAAGILGGLIGRPTTIPALKSRVPLDLVLALIGQGKYGTAISRITAEGKRSLNDFDISDSFNYAMAQWGLTSSPPLEAFRRVVELDDGSGSANRHQCLAIALWALGESDKALARIGEAWQQIVTRAIAEFSGWSYLRLSHDRFLEDLEEIQRLIAGEPMDPRFIRENKNVK